MALVIGLNSGSSCDGVDCVLAEISMADDGQLDAEDVIRHYDVTGKICPKYFVENEDAWSNFKEDVQAAIDRT